MTQVVSKILGESDLFELKEKASQALQSKKVEVGGVEFQVVEKYVPKDAYSSRPHWVIRLVDPTGEKASELVLKHYKLGVAKYLEAEQVHTSHQHQRKGLATFLYLYASMRFRRPFKRSKEQSEEGYSLWKGKLKSAFSPGGLL